MFHNPFGLAVRRRDNWGDGRFLAARTSNDKPRRHNGIDLCVAPNIPILAPCVARVVREKPPYANSPLSGLLLELDGNVEMTFFYLEPDLNIIGRTVVAGDVLGYSQDLTPRYPGITNHLHVGLWDKETGVYLNPSPLFGLTVPT